MRKVNRTISLIPSLYCAVLFGLMFSAFVTANSFNSVENQPTLTLGKCDSRDLVVCRSYGITNLGPPDQAGIEFQSIRSLIFAYKSYFWSAVSQEILL